MCPVSSERPREKLLVLLPTCDTIRVIKTARIPSWPSPLNPWLKLPSQPSPLLQANLVKQKIVLDLKWLEQARARQKSEENSKQTHLPNRTTMVLAIYRTSVPVSHADVGLPARFAHPCLYLTRLMIAHSYSADIVLSPSPNGFETYSTNTSIRVDAMGRLGAGARITICALLWLKPATPLSFRFACRMHDVTLYWAHFIFGII